MAPILLSVLAAATEFRLRSALYERHCFPEIHCVEALVEAPHDRL
jgi:hypothetical protein